MRWTERLRPRSLRGRLTLVLAIGALVLSVALVAGFNIVLRSGLRHDANSAIRTRASAALASVVVRRGRVRVREAPGDEAIDRQIWVFAGPRMLEAPPAPADVRAAAAAAARTPGAYREVAAHDVRLYALPVPRARAAVVAAVSLVPYEHTANRALLASVVLGALVLAAILIVVRFTIGAALRPVDRMTAEVDAWGVDDLDHRLEPTGQDDELARLAATFNDLLGRLAASFRHEQRFSAELSHELRTPLAKLIAESELALRRERTPQQYRDALEGVARDAREMQNVIDTLMAVARSQIDARAGTCDAADVAAAVAESLYSDSGDGVDLELPLRAGLRVGVDSDLAERVLSPVVANALRYARTRVSIALRSGNRTVGFVVRDDGPGVPAAESETIFTPGFRGPSAPSAPPGAGLGLALSRRLAVAAGGDVRYEHNAAPGASFVVTLPAA